MSQHESSDERPRPAPLPEVLSLFPLTGALLLPGTVMPLHLFEPRYCHMVEDAIASTESFGMIQPIVPRQDNRPVPGADPEKPELYPVGCAGRIEHWKRLDDGRILLHLVGAGRFRVVEELPLERGYRRARAEYGEFPEANSTAPERCADRAGLMDVVKDYGERLGLSLPLDEMDAVEDTPLVNGLSVTLPFRPEEQQALLEALTLPEREVVLQRLLQLGERPAESEPSPAQVN